MTLRSQAFTPVRLGRHVLPNRLVMSPMTRSRAKQDGTPGDLSAAYYAQRAGDGKHRSIGAECRFTMF